MSGDKKTLISEETVATEVNPGIYHLLYKGEVVYVGQSMNMQARVGAHVTEGTKLFDSYRLYAYDGDLNELEAEEIIKHKPKYNKGLPKNKKYLSGHQIKKMLNVDRETIHSYIIRNQVPTHTLGLRVYVELKELMKNAEDGLI